MQKRRSKCLAWRSKHIGHFTIKWFVYRLFDNTLTIQLIWPDPFSVPNNGINSFIKLLRFVFRFAFCNFHFPDPNHLPLNAKTQTKNAKQICSTRMLIIFTVVSICWVLLVFFSNPPISIFYLAMQGRCTSIWMILPFIQYSWSRFRWFRSTKW